MSKKRTSAESNNDDLVNDDSECSAKRAKPDLANDTMLQDLPIELLQYILVKVIVLEVKDLKLAKCTWKEKADKVMSRLRTVSCQWNDCIATNSFRNELHRTLDGTAQESIRLDVVRESVIRTKILSLTTLNENIFALGVLSRQKHEEYGVTAYSRSEMSHEVTGVIPLGIGYGVMGPYPWNVTGCRVSNCVYVAIYHPFGDLVLRISKDGEQKFDIHPAWSLHHRYIDAFSVSNNGNLIVLSKKREQNPNAVSIYDSNCSLKGEVKFTIDNEVYRFKNILEKSNGNFVVVYIKKQNRQVNLMEIDRSGSVVHRHESSRKEDSFVTFADSVGRILISETDSGMELLDSELNLLGVYSLEQDEGRRRRLKAVHYDGARNEVVRVHRRQGCTCTTRGLTFFRFTEE